MHDLIPQTALGAATPVIVTRGKLTIRENPDLAFASAAARSGQEAACRNKLTEWLGQDLPGPGRGAASPDKTAVWMSPDQWLVSTAYAEQDDLATRLSHLLGPCASVTEQTGAWACFDINGGAVVDMFERLCATPVRRMRPQDAQRTIIHHMGCFVMCHSPAEEFRVLGPRSSAQSLHHALVAAAESVA
ncbi:MAG: sarcosine oxidase subunit gamma [Roseobacter sp.]|nr:sarcosine oxidase subunit gamma [Roseobacter sp.]